MNQKQILSALIVVFILFIFFEMKSSFQRHKAAAANKDIELFYADLNGRYIGEFFQIQMEMQKLFSNHNLSKEQKERLLFTKDSLRMEFGKIMKKEQ